ncbi:MAG: hypothetical protein JRG83_13490 [Deltaproteobacteria bacterium]|nr:hypothetical protein [Deltaproteobacteria bacterium]
MRFHGSLEDHFADASNGAIEEPFTGFFHTIPHHPDAVGEKYREYPDLASILKSACWLASAPWCRGLFTVSPYIARWLRAHVDVPVSALRHPAPEAPLPFDFEAFRRSEPRRVVHIGQWLRRTETFYALDCPGYEKLLLDVLSHHDWTHIDETVPAEQRSRVDVLARLPDGEFDVLMSRSVAFVDLYDAGACNTVLECIRSGTPLLVNRLPGTEDYLGPGYPLYHEGAEHAASLLADVEAIGEASRVLQKLGTEAVFDLDVFIESVAASDAYQALPMPGPTGPA